MNRVVWHRSGSRFVLFVSINEAGKNRVAITHLFEHEAPEDGCALSGAEPDRPTAQSEVSQKLPGYGSHGHVARLDPGAGTGRSRLVAQPAVEAQNEVAGYRDDGDGKFYGLAGGSRSGGDAHRHGRL